MSRRESGRVKDAERGRSLDVAARRRRLNKALEALEHDNFQEDPHANLVWNKKAPKFEDGAGLVEKGSLKKKKLRGEQFKLRGRKTLQSLLEEEEFTSAPNYFTAKSGPSKFPERHFCSACGFSSAYVCMKCGARYCSVKCLDVHLETRCLKWIV